MELEAVQLVLQVFEVGVNSWRDTDRAKSNCFVKRRTNCNCLKICFQNLAMKMSIADCFGRASSGSISLSITVIHYIVFNVYFVRFL